jgi:hypothetical protein
MSKTRWARLCQDVDCGLRRGAWYRATNLTQSEVVVQVNGRQKSVPLRHMEITADRPTRWTVVANAGNADLIPRFWAKGYAVCPNCTYRQLILGRPQAMRCDDCEGLFEVAWDQPYLQA